MSMSEVGAFARRKCPCCNNPWNLADGDSNEGSRFSCVPCLEDNKGFKGLDPANIGVMSV